MAWSFCEGQCLLHRGWGFRVLILKGLHIATSLPRLVSTQHLVAVRPLEPIRPLQPPPLISDFFKGFSDAELLVVPCLESLVSPLSFTLILWPENSHACFRLSSVLSLQEVLCHLSTCSGTSPTLHTLHYIILCWWALRNIFTRMDPAAHLLHASLETVSQSPVEVP